MLTDTRIIHSAVNLSNQLQQPWICSGGQELGNPKIVGEGNDQVDTWFPPHCNMHLDI